MRVRIVSPILGLVIGIAALPAVACELHQAGHASDRTVTALLAEHGSATQTDGTAQLMTCKPGDATCTTDGSGSCKPDATVCNAK